MIFNSNEFGCVLPHLNICILSDKAGFREIMDRASERRAEAADTVGRFWRLYNGEKLVKLATVEIDSAIDFVVYNKLSSPF